MEEMLKKELEEYRIRLIGLEYSEAQVEMMLSMLKTALLTGYRTGLEAGVNPPQKIRYLENDQPFTCPKCGNRPDYLGGQFDDNGEHYESYFCGQCEEILETVDDEGFTENNFSLSTP